MPFSSDRITLEGFLSGCPQSSRVGLRRQRTNPLVGKKPGCWCCSVAQSCPILCDPMDCHMPGFTISWSFLKPRSVKSMMQEASTSLHKGLTPAQVFQRGLFSSSFKAHDQKTHPTLQPGIQGPWDCTVTSTQKPRICSPSNLLTAGLLCHHQPCRAGPGRVNEPFYVLLWLCVYVVLRHISLRIQPPWPHSRLTPSQPGTVPLGSHKAWHIASTQGCWLREFLSRVSFLSGPTHVTWSWWGGLCVPFSSFHAYENMASLLIRPLQWTVLKLSMILCDFCLLVPSQRPPPF